MHEQKTVLITGASSGIGYAAGKLLAGAGYTVYGTSRKAREDADGIRFKVLDITDGDSIGRLLSSIPPVDVLINNAGASLMSAIEETPIEKVRELFELIFFGHVRMIQGVLPMMRERGSGFILNVTSMAEIMPVPFSIAYAAGKAALHAFTNGLRFEAGAFGIRAATLAPSFIKTPIIQERLIRDGSAYASMILAAGKKRDSSIETGSDPIVVARKILKIINAKNPKSFYAVGRNAHIIHFIRRFFPEALREAIVRRNYSIK